MGDSLAIFNANFLALDDGLCRIPSVVSGPGTNVSLEHSEQSHASLRVSSRNSFTYDTSFTYKNAAVLSQSAALYNGTTLNVTTFPRVTSQSETEPLAVFSSIALTDKAPKVSLFWIASGADNSTVYATNSSISLFDESPIEFNGSVTSLLVSHGLLYVGGEFTAVGGVDCKKFCAINLTTGESDPYLGTKGTLAGNPLSALGDLGTVGTVHAIAEHGNLLIVGGSFESISKGRGLVILDRSTGYVYPFYVNGTVNDLLVVGTDLYVGGQFDFVNYTAQGVSVYSGLRVHTNGLLKISLAMLTSFPNHSIDRSFAANVLTKTFTGPAAINTFAKKGNTIYIGGRFEFASEHSPLATSIAMLSSSGTIDTTWSSVVGGEVFTLAVDGNYLYVGGDFRSFHSTFQFNSTPRTADETTEAYNAVCLTIDNPTNPVLETRWKPRFNGAVTKFAFHDDLFNSYVYCYGRFTEVNGNQFRYIASIEKSYNNTRTGIEALWKMDLQRGPDLINQGLVRLSDSIVVGGNFSKINNQHRKYLARVNGVDESLSTTALSSVAWNFGSHLSSPGTSLEMDFTEFVTVSAYPGLYSTVNQTTFAVDPRTLKGSSEGDLIQFFVRRPRSTSGLNQPVHVIGWKVDYN